MPEQQNIIVMAMFLRGSQSSFAKKLRVEHSDWDIRIAIDKTKTNSKENKSKEKRARALISKDDWFPR